MRPAEIEAALQTAQLCSAIRKAGMAAYLNSALITSSPRRDSRDLPMGPPNRPTPRLGPTRRRAGKPHRKLIQHPPTAAAAVANKASYRGRPLYGVTYSWRRCAPAACAAAQAARADCAGRLRRASIDRFTRALGLLGERLCVCARAATSPRT